MTGSDAMKSPPIGLQRKCPRQRRSLPRFPHVVSERIAKARFQSDRLRKRALPWDHQRRAKRQVLQYDLKDLSM